MGELLRKMPIGFRFDPTDEELILGYLLPKVRGIALPWSWILEKEVYGDKNAPWDIFRDVDDMYWYTQREGKGVKKTIYVFTKLFSATSNPNCKNKSRRAGSGTWSGQTSPKNIKDSTNGQIIGSSRMFSYQYSTSGAVGSFGHWIMHEYFLDGCLSNNSDIVLCKITKCLKAKENDDTMQQSQQPEFLYPTYGGGGGTQLPPARFSASDGVVQVPTAVEKTKTNKKKRRCAKESQSENDAAAYGNKKQKLYFGFDDDNNDVLVGFGSDNTVREWNDEDFSELYEALSNKTTVVR